MKTLIDLNMLNSVVVFVCPVWNPFLANLVQKKWKLSVKDEIWYINKLKCAKFDDNVHSYLNRKFPFWANLVQKVKTVWIKWNLVPEYAEFDSDVYIFFFGPKVPSLDKFVIKNENCVLFTIECGVFSK